MLFPSELKYTQDHEWIAERDGIFYIGITDFAQSELGDIVFVEIESEGQQIAAGEIFGTIEAVKTVSELYMPIAGTVSQVNIELEKSPELVNSDPYGKGWLIAIIPDQLSDIDQLLSSQDYQDKIGK